jgi:DNA-binding transcriptional LysR family regulator
MLRLRHIEVFYAVFRCGSISAASRELNVSQPSVSKVLRHAEDQLGYPLFERSRGRLTPTQAAYELFDKVEEVYFHVVSLNEIARNIGRRKGGHLRIGVLPSLGLWVIPLAVSRFVRTHPEVTFEIDTLHTREVAGALLEQSHDVAIGYGPPPSPRLDAHELGQSELLLAARRDVFDPDRPTVSVRDLDGVDFIGLRGSGPSGDLFMERLAAENVVLNEVVIARTYYVALALVRQGVGVSVIDTFTAASAADPDLVTLPFESPIRYPITAVTDQTLRQPQLVAAFLETIRAVLAEQGA